MEPLLPRMLELHLEDTDENAVGVMGWFVSFSRGVRTVMGYLSGAEIED
jgi:hypothetical protein